MKTVLLLTSLVLSFISCQAGPAVECQWGPSYWCQSKQTAAQCGQEAYCNSRVWKVQPDAQVQGVKSVQCDVCKIIVQFVDKEIDNNKTESEAQAAVESICSVLGSLKDECDTLVDDFFPQIWAALTSNLDPDTVCSTIGLCTSDKLQKVAELPVKVKSVECDVCKMLVGYVDKFVEKNTSEAEAKAAVEELCDALGSLKDECETFVNSSFDKIWQMLINQLDPTTVCTEIGLCKSSKLQKVAKLPVKVKSVQCDVCKIVVKYLDKYVESNATEAEAEAALKDFCDLLGSLKDECDTLVNTFFPQIWQMLMNQADPDTVCTEIKLCTSGAVAKVQSEAGGLECDACKMVAELMHKYADENKTEGDVQRELEGFCKILGSLRSECDSLLENFFPQIWDMIIKDLDPSTICSELKLCSSQVAEVQKQAVSPVKSTECDFCKIIAMYLNKFIASNGTEAEAEDEVKKLCSLLGSESSKCNMVVDLFFDQIWKMVVDETELDVICQLLKLCDNTTALKQPPLSGDVTCDFCQLVFVFIRPFIDDNDTEDDIRDSLEDNLCNNFFMPDAQNKCVNFFETYFGYIWGNMRNEVDAGLICKDIGVCTKLPSRPIRRKIRMPKQTLCELCKLVVSYLKPFVDSNSTEMEVEQALESLCSILPATYKKDCTTFVDDNFEEIWKALKEEVDSNMICKQIGVCNNTVAMVTKLPVSKPKHLSLPKQTACDLCKLVVNFLEKYVDTNATESEVKQALDQLCAILPSGFKDECTDLVNKNFGTIWLLVKSEFDNDLICKQIGLCNSSAVVALPQLPSLKPSLTQQSACDMCKLVVTLIKPYVNSNSTESEVEEQLDELCNLLPGNYSKQCNGLLDDFFPSIWDMLKGEFDSDKICDQLKLCNSSSCTKSLSTKRLSAALSPACDVCKILSHFLKPFADNKTTEDNAVAAVEKLCTYLPTDYSQTCKNMSEKYFRQFWDDLQKELDSDTLCADAGICQSKQLEVSGPLCVLCEFVMKELESMLDSNSTDAEIKAALDKVCSLLPSSIKDDCDGFVNTYGEDIIKLLLEAVSPKVVCTLLHLCLGAETSSVAVMPVVESVEMDDCLLCKTVLGFVKTLVNNYQKPIEGALDDVCDFMPSTIKSECTAFVNEFGPVIIQLVDKEINPDQLCKDLKACKESSLMTPWMKLARAKSF